MKLYKAKRKEMSYELIQALAKQRIAADKIARSLGLSFLPIIDKRNFTGYLNGNRQVIPIEVKMRNCNYGTYGTTLVEYDLMIKLRNAVDKNQFTTCYYAEVFNDGVAIVFDLTVTPFIWTEQKCNSNTLDSKSKNGKTIKKVAFVAYDLGTEIELDADPSEKVAIKTSKSLF